MRFSGRRNSIGTEGVHRLDVLDRQLGPVEPCLLDGLEQLAEVHSQDFGDGDILPVRHSSEHVLRDSGAELEEEPSKPQDDVP